MLIKFSTTLTLLASRILRVCKYLATNLDFKRWHFRVLKLETAEDFHNPEERNRNGGGEIGGFIFHLAAYQS